MLRSLRGEIERSVREETEARLKDELARRRQEANLAAQKIQAREPMTDDR